MATLQPHVRLNRARLFVLAALLLALVRFRTTNLARLCLALPGPGHESSAYRRLQRFFAQVALSDRMLHDLLMRHAPDGPLLLALDRTEWKVAGHTHNLLVIGYLHNGVVVPLAWRALGKCGSTRQVERIALMGELLERLPAERIAALLGDREFIGKDFLRWLDKQGVSFVIRARKNAWMHRVGKESAQIEPMFRALPDGSRRRLRGKWSVYGVPCFVTASKRDGSAWLLISNRRPNQAEVLYAQRWQIETLFGVLKSRGFDLEATHIGKPERIERVFGVLAVALVWVLGVGQLRHQKRPEKMASHGRLRRSLFRVGLDGLTRMLDQHDWRALRRSFLVLSCT
jgi:hypothetical protein